MRWCALRAGLNCRSRTCVLRKISRWVYAGRFFTYRCLLLHIKQKTELLLGFNFMRREGLEPSSLAACAPQTHAYTNSATCAKKRLQRGIKEQRYFSYFTKKIHRGQLPPPVYLPVLAGADAGISTLSNTEDEAFLLEAIVSTIDVAISTAAKIAVNLFTALNAVGLANKLSAPEAPKIPAAEPFPLCNNTSKISKIQTIKCKVKISPYMKWSPF